MINFTHKYINFVSLVISIIIFLFLNNYVFSIYKIDSEDNVLNQSQKSIEQIENNIENVTKENNKNTVKPANSNTQKQNNVNSINTKSSKKIEWRIEIPKINLKAEIAEGTTTEVMDSFVGHFEETSKDKGNIGLAAHNRGYKVNYFQDLKKLKEGDEIIYTYNGKQRKYSVKVLKIITDTDWTMLENTAENKITLITCVENQPEYRRCVQAVEIN